LTVKFQKSNFEKNIRLKKYFHFRGKKIYYSDQGRGPAVLLIHGYLETGEVWDSFAEKLARHYRVLTIDLPGHGRSDIFAKTHTTEFMAETAEGLLKTVDVGKAFITGHSMGGYVTLAFLGMYPQKLTGYCLFHSHPFADTPEVAERRKNDIRMVEAGQKFILYPESVRKMYAASNPEKFKEAFEKSKKIASGISDEGITAVLRGLMIRPSRVHLMEEGKVPCLWILGEKDNYIQCEQMKSRVNLPANAEVVILKDSGHMGFIEEEEKSLQILQNFISKIL